MKNVSSLYIDAKELLKEVGLDADKSCIVKVEYNVVEDVISIIIKSADKVEGVTVESFMARRKKINVGVSQSKNWSELFDEK